MKKITLLLFPALLLLSAIKHEIITPPLRTNKFNNSNDTTFLLKEKRTGYYHVVFIEKNRQSRVYKNVLNFKMDHYDREAYLQNYQTVKAHLKKPFKRYNLAVLPKEWLPLYSYKGRFYIYQPSEPGNMDRVAFTDSTIMHWFMDGPMPQPLKVVNRLNKYTWQLKSQGYQQLGRNNDIIIHIIDPVTKMAVWEDTNAPVKDRYSLYVPRTNAKTFDLVVNYCRQNKVAEFNFDSVDYGALLKKAASLATSHPQ